MTLNRKAILSGFAAGVIGCAVIYLAISGSSGSRRTPAREPAPGRDLESPVEAAEPAEPGQPPERTAETPEPPPPVAEVEAEPPPPVAEVDFEKAPDPPDPPAAPQPEDPAEPFAGIEWKLVDERPLLGTKSQADYRPYYVFQANEVGLRSGGRPMKWHHYDDEPEAEYRPSREYLLDASRVMDRWLRLSKQAPHTVRWEVTFALTVGRSALTVEPNGVILGEARGDVVFPVARDGEHTVVIERAGKRLRVTLDDFEPGTQEIPADDRVPLRISAQKHPIVIRRCRLLFGNGEGLSPAPKLAAGPRKAPKWEVVYSESFPTAESIQSFVPHPQRGLFEWNQAAKSMGMGPQAGAEEMYLVLKRSLPGDARIRFRARSRRPNQPPFFAIMLHVKGGLKKADGYFIEWNYWQAQIKKLDVRKAGAKVSYYRSGSNSEWMNFSAERIGATITMYVEGEKVLTWTDPYPYKGSDHDLFAFYIWRVHMEFDDIVIERNLNDPTRPRLDHPAVPDNFIYGQRSVKNETPELDEF